MVTIKYNGNLGNKLFELWSAAGIGKKNNHGVRYLNDELFQYFNGPFTFIDSNQINAKAVESAFNYSGVDLTGYPSDKFTVQLEGYYQSEQYWLPVEKGLRKAFTFKSDFVQATKDKVPGLFNAETICLSIRRGDFVGNKTYYQLPITYYIGALLTEFPDFEKYNILILSDDMEYCRVHFECLPNVHFADGLNAYEQLCLGSLCDNHIISNSTFSWWCAYLADRKKVIRPKHNFGDEYRQTHPEDDYWPETKQWLVFDHEEYKIPLQDATFMVPVYHDHNDRKQNLDLAVCMLQRDFHTNVFVMENKSSKFGYMEQWCTYERVDFEHFHRTRMLNLMAVQIQTPYIVNWDADVIVPPLQVYLSIYSLRQNYARICYPYDGRFVRVLRKPNFPVISKALDIGVFGSQTQFDNGPIKGKGMASTSVGGAVAMNRLSFIWSGLENEHMVSYAPEDCERWDRWHILGFKVTRVTGKLFHLDHWCGADSCSKNPYFYANHKELEKIRGMDRTQLNDYIAGWQWRRKAIESLPPAERTAIGG